MLNAISVVISLLNALVEYAKNKQLITAGIAIQFAKELEASNETLRKFAQIDKDISAMSDNDAISELSKYRKK